MTAFARRTGRVAIVGHRGGRSYAGEAWPAENTLTAFARAHAEAADAIELDVRTSRDGAVVVFHDADLARMTGGTDRRAIASLSARELARVQLFPSPAAIPTRRAHAGFSRVDREGACGARLRGRVDRE